MTSPGRYPPPDGSYARSSGDPATKGVVLIVLAVAIGVVLLWRGGVGGDETLVIDPDASGDAAGDAAATGDDAATGDPETTDTTPDDTAVDSEGVTDTTPEVTVPAPTSTRPLAEVKVVVANGVGERGLAGTRAGILTTAGYVTAAADAATSPTALSTVFYVAGYENEAAGVAAELGGTSALLRPAPVAPQDPLDLLAANYRAAADGFHIFVVLGADRALG